MIAVPAVLVLWWPHLFGDWHALLQQSVHVIVKLLLEEATVTAQREGHMQAASRRFMASEKNTAILVTTYHEANSLWGKIGSRINSLLNRIYKLDTSVVLLDTQNGHQPFLAFELLLRQKNEQKKNEHKETKIIKNRSVPVSKLLDYEAAWGRISSVYVGSNNTDWSTLYLLQFQVIPCGI